MESFGDNIWILDGDRVRMFGVIPFATRMAAVRLETGGLWVWSPVNPTPERQSAVDALGAVAHIVAPNKIHSLGVRPWQAAHPEARTWASPGFPDRHPTIPIDGLLTAEAEPPWRDEILHRVIDGHAFLDEVAFLHRASKTLILTDYIQKHEVTGETWFWRGVKSMVKTSA